MIGKGLGFRYIWIGYKVIYPECVGLTVNTL